MSPARPRHRATLEDSTRPMVAIHWTAERLLPNSAWIMGMATLMLP